MTNIPLLVQRNLKGLKTEFNLNAENSFFERILTDERSNLRPIFKIGKSHFKVQFKENVLIYSIIVSVADTTNDIGYYSINIYSNKEVFFSNYFEILNQLNDEYIKSNFKTSDAKEKLNIILKQLNGIKLSNYILYLNQIASKNVVFSIDTISDFEVAKNNVFVFESIYYIPTEIYNSDKAKQLFNSPRFLEPKNLDKHFQLYTIENQENFENCNFYIDEKRLTNIPTSFNKLYFFLNNNSTLTYNYESTIGQPKKPITNNYFTIPKYTTPIQESHRNESRDGNYIEVNSLKTKLKTYKILSAVLGALLLITLIGGLYYWFYNIKDCKESSNTETSETTGNEGYTLDGNSEVTTNIKDTGVLVSNSDSLSDAKAKAEKGAKAKEEKDAKAKAEKGAKTKAEKDAKAKTEKDAKAKNGVNSQNHLE